MVTLNHYETVFQLTLGTLPSSERLRLLGAFAADLGWRPSDRLELPALADVATSHLLVEHGLENTAVISFLKQPLRLSDLGVQEQQRLYQVSYNNLVDWHIPIESDTVNFVYIRTSTPTLVERHRISRDSFEKLRSEAFEQASGKKPNPNLPALDDALMKTLSNWKRNLKAELGPAVTTQAISALFNSIIFARALEDQTRRLQFSTSQGLVEEWLKASGQARTLRQVLARTIRRFAQAPTPKFLFDEKQLEPFDNLDEHMSSGLLSDFYRNKFAPYAFDFSVMSKHALSRIYEHYVSLLSHEPTEQLSLLPTPPKESYNKSTGSFYTPQFIARFFARFLREQLPPAVFRRLRSIDPACGSGIFLRTLLELQCDPTQEVVSSEAVDVAFANVFGIDADENATQATRLSISLLYLVLNGGLPGHLEIHNADALEFIEKRPEIKGAFDVVVANPPFVAFDALSEEMRERVSAILGEHSSGKVDLYLAFLRLAIELMKPGGFGLFVLPHSFLLGRNAKGVRQFIAQTCWVHCIADLSAVPVFEDLGIYVVLLIFQKRPTNQVIEPPCTVIKCRDLVARALQDAADGRRTQNAAYSIYEIEQDTFSEPEWLILPGVEAAIKRRAKRLPHLEEFVVIRQGFVSGADDVFIIPRSRIPPGESAIYVHYLPDREMQTYVTPSRSDLVFFYPFQEGEVIEEEALRSNFPETWKYLSGHRSRLADRGGLARYKKKWWEPMWPRPPSNMMRPKIISPHLVLVPRFSLDEEGRFAVSRAPLLYPKEEAAGSELLLFLLAILNSAACFWHVSANSHVYRGGYVMLEPATLKRTPVPDPARVSPAELKRILQLVEARRNGPKDSWVEVERAIDRAAADLYGLSGAERRAIGMED